MLFLISIPFQCAGFNTHSGQVNQILSPWKKRKIRIKHHWRIWQKGCIPKQPGLNIINLTAIDVTGNSARGLLPRVVHLGESQHRLHLISASNLHWTLPPLFRVKQEHAVSHHSNCSCWKTSSSALMRIQNVRRKSSQSQFWYAAASARRTRAKVHRSQGENAPAARQEFGKSP